ncbi:MAG TPA: gamma-glutamyl-gamma-aminobutyrate hydrolase family protein [Candidatus Nanopelagicales bacterium]|nr:gamma-glutamyl-gamma-aminobutyrate hydrolase family protein [Candidatus Nanopelagicales bacterium]
MSSVPVVQVQEVMPEHDGPRTGPRLVVLVSLNFPDLNDHVAGLVRALTKVALEEVASLGFDWRLVDTSAPLPEVDDVLDTDAVLILGGGDVDSELYGVPGPVPHEYGVDVAADRFTIDAIRGAVDGDVPLLAVCRGVQLLNVAYGGTLVPDLDPSHLHHGDHDSGLFLDEHVRIDEGTRLLEILHERDWHVRNGHHQAVDAVAPGLRRAAVADDGIVEAVEHPTAWAIGVQWHPEESDGPGDDRALLWRALRDAAQERLSR